MPLVVQKYGGTSVNTPEKREKVLERIIAAKDSGNDVVVVVSAMGRKGEPYATDTLLDMLKEVGPAPTGKTKDLLASCGEIISACVVAHALKEKGYNAVPMTGFQAGIVTDSSFTNADAVRVDPERIIMSLKEGNIVVAAGFQGITEDMEVTTLGRGGSDTTALILGGALEADLVEIYTDVPGVAFTDPRLVPNVPFLKSIDFAPMYALARAGAKVIHLRAVKNAINFNRPFIIRSTFSDEPGTLIGKPGESFNGIYGIALLKDINIVRLKKAANEDFWKKFAVDELFFKTDNKGISLAVQVDDILEETRGISYTMDGECSLVTAVWDSRLTGVADAAESQLKDNGLDIIEFYEIENGRAWALPKNQAVDAIRALVEYSIPGEAAAV